MKLAGQSDEETFAIAIMDDFMEGSTEIDFSMHTTSFTDGWRNGHQGTSERFSGLTKLNGDIVLERNGLQSFVVLLPLPSFE